MVGVYRTDQSLGIWDATTSTQLSSIIPHTDTGTSGELRCLHYITPTTSLSAMADNSDNMETPSLLTGNGNGALQLWNINHTTGVATQLAHVCICTPHASLVCHVSFECLLIL
jgi:WD40 repeat protein